MSSALGFVAYAFHAPQTSGGLETRIRHARARFQSLNTAALEEVAAGDGQTGIVGWKPTDRAVVWEPYVKRGGAATAWLHVPALAGAPGSDCDPWTLASDVLDDRVASSALGSPYALARWESGELRLQNDTLGLVRLFHYSWPEGDVWSSRQDLAHVFMARTPERNALAWAGMATYGWAVGGHTQMGGGAQLKGGTRVRASVANGQLAIRTERNFGAWLEDARANAAPDPSALLRDMEMVMSTARRWPRAAIADLSGGKDSRVISAIGLRSGSVEALRTIATDPGEVDTAKRLMGLVDTDVPHVVVGRGTTNDRKRAPLLARLMSRHRGFEGRYLAPTAYNGGMFAGFKSEQQPRFNGLGGEVVAGSNFASGSWREKLLGAPTIAARERLVAMARSSHGVAPDVLSIGCELGEQAARESEALGMKTADAVLDLFYATDRMPYWAVTFTVDSNLCPLFAPSVLTRAMHSLGVPQEPGAFQRQILEVAMPRWAEVPFYSPTFGTRVAVPAWQREDWADTRAFIEQRVESLTSDHATAVTALLRTISDGKPGKAHEVAIARFVWDAAFDDYLAEVRAVVDAVRKDLAIGAGGRDLP